MKTKINSKCLFFLALLILLSACKSFAVLHIDTSYNGKFRHTKQFAKILADLPFVYQEAFQRIGKSLGIPAREQIYVIVAFSDHLTYKGFRLRGKRQSVRTANRSLIHYIHLDLDFLVNGQATLIEEMTHEMTHAVMADIMGLRSYDRLPMWVKEGTAVHAADQGLARIKALTRKGVDLNKIGAEDENLSGNPISLEKYVENYLKIRFLLKTFGSNALHRFVKRLMKTGNVKQELSVCFNGLTESVMNQYSQDFIRKTLLDNCRPIQASDNLKRGIRFFDEGEYLSARLAFTDAIYSGLSNKEFQKAAYLLAECYIQERNPQGALNLLKQIRPDPNSVPVDRYQFLSAYSEYAMGLCTKAYFGFKKAFETSKSRTVQEGSLYYIIRILIELGNHTEAQKVLTMMKRKYPRSHYIALTERVIKTSF